MSKTLRDHLRKRHGQVTVPRANEHAIKMHHRLHHRLTWSHIHTGGMGRGPDDRPEGWTTGEDVEERT